MQKENSFSIFVADDNEINRLLLRSQLDSYSKNITLAKDGKEAYKLLVDNRYDLILLDLQMPYFTGLDLLEMIKKPESINRDTPVIAITAHAQNYQRKTLIEAGFDECLIKPILLEELTEVLNLWGTEEKPSTESKQYNNHYIAAMLKKTLGNKTLANTIFYRLFTELPQQALTIESALLANDLVLAKHITHTLHGSVAFCGFVDFQSTANDLENSLLEKNQQSINQNFIALKDNVIDFMKSKANILEELID